MTEKTERGMEILRKEFIFWSRMGFGSDPAELDEEGMPIFFEDIHKMVRYHKQMADAGVKVHSCILHNGWVGIDKFDPRGAERILQALFEECPDVYFIPRIKLNPPYEWQKAHPEELYLYEEGAEASAEEIAAAVNTPSQDSTGSVPTPGLKGGRVARRMLGHQSFASDVWKKDACAALGRMIDYLENSPYAQRILGYHIAYGKCGETHVWGNDELRCDFSKANRKKFFAFGVKKYGSAEELARAWSMETILPEKCPIPSNEGNLAVAKELEEFFHTREEDAMYRDYQEFRREISYEALHTFAHFAKEKTGKPVGSFHGYILASGANHHGHTDLQWVMDDPDIDFLAAPKSYYRTGFGEPGGSYCVAQSVNRKMLWVDELDNRTHLARPKILGATDNFEQTRWVMWREFSRNEAAGAAYWWMDLGDGWYDDPELLAEIGRIYEKKQELAAKKKESIAEILVVADEEASLYTQQPMEFYMKALQDTLCELALTGAPYDLYRQADLKEIDLSRYRLVVFLQPFAITTEEFRTLAFRKDARFVWNYLPGGSVEEAKRLTGMQMRATGKGESFPYLEVLPEGVLAEKRYGDGDAVGGKIPEMWEARERCLEEVPVGAISVARRENHVVCALPALGREMLRKLGEEAGCRFYAPVGSIVYGDSRFLGIFTEDGFEITDSGKIL